VASFIEEACQPLPGFGACVDFHGSDLPSFDPKLSGEETFGLADASNSW
jgi:hypothetical protein